MVGASRVQTLNAQARGTELHSADKSLAEDLKDRTKGASRRGSGGAQRSVEATLNFLGARAYVCLPKIAAIKENVFVNAGYVEAVRTRFCCSERRI